LLKETIVFVIEHCHISLDYVMYMTLYIVYFLLISNITL